MFEINDPPSHISLDSINSDVSYLTSYHSLLTYIKIKRLSKYLTYIVNEIIYRFISCNLNFKRSQFITFYEK